jgi:chromosome partitioning protein
MGRIVSFVNRKGGVGKTSTVHHLAGPLSRKGLRVLLVDADPQSSLTQGLLGPEALRGLDPRETIAALFDEIGGPPMAELARPTGLPGIDLLAGSERMFDYNQPRPWETGPLQFILRDALAELDAAYDLVLIDCPPHIQLVAWAALVAAHGVVVPLQAEDYGAQGLVSILDTIEQVRISANPSLALIGFLVTMYNKALSVHVTYDTNLRALYGDEAFTATVPLAKDFKEAVTLRKTVGAYKPRSAAAKAVDALADELLARLDARLGQADAAEARRVA